MHGQNLQSAQAGSILHSSLSTVTYEQNAEFTRHRLEIANRFADLRERKQAIRLYEIELRAGRSAGNSQSGAAPAGFAASSLDARKNPNGASSPTEVAQTKI